MIRILISVLLAVLFGFAAFLFVKKNKTVDQAIYYRNWKRHVTKQGKKAFKKSKKH